MEGLQMKSKVEWFFIIILLGVVSLSVVLAVPLGPSSFETIGSSRYSESNAANVSAIAGNVTELNFIANTVTQTWQGYFGNITGTIVLGNSNNQSMYNWNISAPSGEVYATRTSDVPAWASITCADQAAVDLEDTALGVNPTVDQDSVNKTFVNITFTPFFVGNVNINDTQDCRAVNLYDQNGVSSSNFQEVLLHSGADMIYTALITQDSLGFDNRAHDFEMLVGENGHNGDTDVTPYYFYIELQ
jgi:hypothetical protein